MSDLKQKKDSTLKIVLPVVLIPIILVLVVTFLLVGAYNDGFSNSISQKDIEKYLQTKYRRDLKDIELINTIRFSEVKRWFWLP